MIDLPVGKHGTLRCPVDLRRLRPVRHKFMLECPAHCCDYEVRYLDLMLAGFA